MSNAGLEAHRTVVAEAMKARREDIVWMASTGESAVGAADRLGIRPDALEKWCRLHDLGEEYRALRSRDPLDIETTLNVRGRAGAAARWGWAS